METNLSNINNIQNSQLTNQPPYNQIQNPQIIQNIPPFSSNNSTLPYQAIQSTQIQETNVPLLSKPNTNLSLNTVECFEDLNSSSESLITKYLDNKCWCPKIKYDISIKYKDGGVDRNIFFGEIESCGLQNMYDFFNVYIKYIPRDCNISDDVKNQKNKERFFDVSSVSICPKKVQVYNVENNTIFGEIQQPFICCCSDPDFQIRNSLNILKYRVVTDGCQCAYCCCNGYCRCFLGYPVNYSILDSTHTQILGNIFKSKYSFCDKEMLTYRIVFPIDSTPEDKILIISTALAIDNYVYYSLTKQRNN